MFEIIRLASSQPAPSRNIFPSAPARLAAAFLCAWLAFSSTARLYAIKSAEEARAYLDHPVLGARLVECAEAALGVEGRSATEIFGSPDDLKLRSCATLFACVSPAGSVFERLLDKFFQGVRDEKTLRLTGTASRGA